ncbi:LysM peptidoglycan-binding domain-containing protein [Horticoccus luteus]|uniref:LysM peptidoglycan-binding domain-containing protein n=1 Tax=Horticoccus luteus TaxID=2862869 RepID=A0A8F9XIY5_9BACT|nr:LysM peptidoglycan-binding domain-containing protein [Horticoccus luteus]QYM78083.1 LysM peptidoglycan-binding domain-containing protein [Horticoccus luteus]
MKILKVFGIVVGIHVFALILIFANPGCSSTAKPAPADTAAKDAAADSSPMVSVPMSDAAPSNNSADAATAMSTPSPVVSAPLDYGSSAGVRYTPTRPGSDAAQAVRGPAPVEGVTPVTTYTVAKGDSLWTVAKKHHLSVTQLAAANHIKPATPLRLGQKLIIPTTAVAAAPTDNLALGKPAAVADEGKASSASPVKHVVKPGETLGGIAHKYGVPYGEIALVNNISDPTKIRPGMELIIPAPKNRPGKSTSTPAAKPTSKAAANAPAPTPQTTTPVVPTPDQSKPFFTPPPADRDLDSGIKPGATDAPVIQIEDPNRK